MTVKTFFEAAEPVKSGLTVPQYLGTLAAHATKSHYDAPFASVVERRTYDGGATFAFMDSGTSSEALWQDRMTEILPKLGLTPAQVTIVPLEDVFK